MAVPSSDTTHQLSKFKEIIFDCDGVIIDSIKSKTDTVVELLSPLTDEEEQQIRSYHQHRPGIHRTSLFRHCRDHILNQPATEEEINTLCSQFNQRVSSFMPELPLVDGLEEFLQNFQDKFRYHVVSGAPQQELEDILRKQGIAHYFDVISGSPPEKPERAASILETSAHGEGAFLLIGDAQEDLEVAQYIGAPMVFRPSTDKIELDSPSILHRIDDFHQLAQILK